MKELKQKYLGTYTIYETGIKSIPIRIGVCINNKRTKEIGCPDYHFRASNEYTNPTLDELKLFHKELGKFIDCLILEE